MQRWVGFPILLAILLGVSRPALAQGRLSDKDLQGLIQSLKDEAQPFRQTFANALKQSTIRKTSKEKDARMLADSFAKQANSALESFKKNQKAEAAVTELVHTATQIDPLVYSLQLDSQTTSQWEKMRSELHQIAQAYGIPEPYLAPQGASAALSTKGSCLNAVGVTRSRQLVNECLQVSPATHPPCNAQNSCAMIVDEIKRGCGLIGQGAPGFCLEYK
jgi:aminopeptidase N